MKSLLSLASAAAALSSLAAAEQPYSTWMSDSFPQKGINKTRKYEEAVLYRGIELAYAATGNQTYADWVQTQVDGVVADNGSIAGYPSALDSLDDIRIGTILLDLYTRTNATKYRTAAGLLREQLNYQPRTPSGGFWHRSPTYPNQMWLDGIYMADVFYAQWTSLFDAANATAWDDIIRQFELIEAHTRNASSNLLYHGYDESGEAVWAAPGTGASPHVWIRALGWYMMALLDTLDFFPADHSARPRLVDWYVALAEGVVAAQDALTAGWWLVMDQPYPGMEGNYIESSGTAMFTYGLLKGVRMGYVGEEYAEPALKAYDLMVNEFVARNATGGMLNWEGTVLVGSLSGNASYEYYISVAIDENDLKGVGPFIYASVEKEARQ